MTARLRDSLVLEYGGLLAEHRSLWAAGLSYLAAAPPEGLRRAELLLERIPARSEAKAMRLAGEARRLGLAGAAAAVGAAVGARRLGAGRLGAALAWAVRARAAPLCARAAQQALRRYAQGDGEGGGRGGRLPAADLLLTAGAALLLADPLVFLGQSFILMSHRTRNVK